jgi:hypothetical protein
MGDRELMNIFSFPLAAHFLSLNGHPSRFTSGGPAIVFGPAASKLDDAAMLKGVAIDRWAARILEARGIDTGIGSRGGKGGFFTHVDKSGRRFAVFDFDIAKFDFASYSPYSHCAELEEALRFVKAEPFCRVKGTGRVYQIVQRNPADGSWSVLLENLSAEPCDVEVVAPGKVGVVESLRGEFLAGGKILKLEKLAPHEYAAVRFVVK